MSTLTIQQLISYLSNKPYVEQVVVKQPEQSIDNNIFGIPVTIFKLDSFNKSINISFYLSIFHCLDSNFKNLSRSELCAFVDEFILILLSKHSTMLHDKIKEYSGDIQITQLVADYFLTNIFILENDTLKCTFVGNEYDISKSNIIIAKYNDIYNPIFYNEDTFYTELHPLMKAINENIYKIEMRHFEQEISLKLKLNELQDIAKLREIPITKLFNGKSKNKTKQELYDELIDDLLMISAGKSS